MKKLTIVSILLVAILSLVGCSGITTHDQREYEALPSTAKIVDETIIEEEQVEEKQEEQEEDKQETQEEDKQEERILDTKDYKEPKGVWKKMLVKIVGENEIIEYEPNYIIIDGVVYTNPENNPDIDLNALGIKHLFIDDMPKYDVETEKIIRYYYDDGKLIHRAWKVEKLTEEEIETQRK